MHQGLLGHRQGVAGARGGQLAFAALAVVMGRGPALPVHLADPLGEDQFDRIQFGRATQDLQALQFVLDGGQTHGSPWMPDGKAGASLF